MRDNKWLEEKMWDILENHFADVPVTNDIIIKFGRRARQRLGSIKRKECVGNSPSSSAGRHGHSLHRFAKTFGFRDSGSGSGMTPGGAGEDFGGQEGKDNPSIITITGYFKDEQVPEFVVLATIAHELAHYAHGFSSPLEQRFQHPHQGGVVRKELEYRGLGSLEKKAKKWLKTYWREHVYK